MPAFNYEVVIPAYNAGKTLQILLDQIKQLPQKPVNIRIIDDGSSDNTANIAMRNAVKLVSIPHNKGKGFALRTGFSEFLNNGNTEYLLCMDADLQHPVEVIPDFVNEIISNSYKILIGKRKWNLTNMPLMRIISNTLSSRILSFKTRQPIFDSQCGFRMIHRCVLERIMLKEDGFQMETEFIIKTSRAGFNIHFVSIPTIYNKSISKIKHIKDTYSFVRLIIKG